MVFQQFTARNFRDMYILNRCCLDHPSKISTVVHQTARNARSLQVTLSTTPTLIHKNKPWPDTCTCTHVMMLGWCWQISLLRHSCAGNECLLRHCGLAVRSNALFGVDSSSEWGKHNTYMYVQWTPLIHVHVKSDEKIMVSLYCRVAHKHLALTKDRWYSCASFLTSHSYSCQTTYHHIR